MPVNKDPMYLCGIEVIGIIDIAACAAAAGAALALGGEVAAVLQGVPIKTTDAVLHVHPDHLTILVDATAAAHRDVLRYPDCGLELWFAGIGAAVSTAEVLPATTAERQAAESIP